MTFSFGTVGKSVLLLALIALSIVISADLETKQPFIGRAFADGFSTEIIPGASLGDRKPALFVQVNPPVLTSESTQDTFMRFRFFDLNTNQTITHTSYLLTVTKDDKTLLLDQFHSHSGLLTIKVQPNNDQQVTVYGDQDPSIPETWIADPSGVMSIRGPLLLEGGLYHFHVVITGIDNDKYLFVSGTEPTFDSWLSVGDVFHENLAFNGQPYNVTLVSYYDKIRDFKFDTSAKAVSWAMPFDYNTTRINQQNIFVHEEIKIPKSFHDFIDTGSFAGTVNGSPISKSKISIDPYSSNDALILHYLLNKNDILSIAGRAPSGKTVMDFTLSPDENPVEETSGEMTTDTGNILVSASWTPAQLGANSESTLAMAFFDGLSGNRINDNVRYDLKILDAKGGVVYEKSDLLAKGGTGNQTVTFPRNETYHVEVNVKALMRDGQTPDTTRNGIARGIVVVPEFGPVAGTIMALSFVAAILLTRRNCRR